METVEFKFQINDNVSYMVTFFMNGDEVKDVTTIRTPFDDSLTFEQFLEETKVIDYKALLNQIRRPAIQASSK